MAKKVTRLFEQFAPENYKIKLEIANDKQSFKGSIVIIGKKKGRPSERITFHQKGLKIRNAAITRNDKTGDIVVELTRTLLQNKRDEVRLHATKKLYPGRYTIAMDFEGVITKNMDGVYPCFFEVDGEQKELIATQFESHHAREAFPCIDEPEAKATFDISLTHAQDETALSNTEVISTNEKNGLTTTVFSTTPIMSTYLVAFVVGDMRYKEAVSKNGVKIRTYATPDQVEFTEFALENAVKCMDYYEDYFDIPFPLGKCDFVALPDFASGAMENWGLITFREQALLCDEKTTSLSTKQWVAMVVAHELTHQWFGNLVTMRWWTDLWLNEGFASWMEYLALGELYPDWNMWTQFTVDEQQTALKADALEHTHPIEVPVRHPDEIRTIFDTISYQKGSSAIHMLFNYLGPEEFKNGIRHYLKKHAYSNTDTIDLWQALEDDSKKPVKDFMGAWTSQSGFPIVNAEIKNDHLELIQSRFVVNPSSPAREENTLWPIPLLCGELDRALITKKVSNVPFNSKKRPLKLNLGQTGFYRVNYTHEMQTAQIKAIYEGKFEAIDRMGLLSDSFENTRAGYQPVSEYLDLLGHYENEDSLPAWEIVAASVGAIRLTLSASDTDDSLRDIMKPFVRELVKAQLSRLTWDEKPNESHLDKLLRPIIIGLAAAADEPSIMKKINEAYKIRLAQGEGSINSDLRAIVYSTIARNGGQKEYDELLEMYKLTKSSDEKLSLTAGITSFEQIEIVNQFLELIKSDTVRTQDNGYWIAYGFMNRHARSATWEWMKQNWNWMLQTMGTDLSFSRTPIYAARSFADEEHIKDYVLFFSDKMTPTIERSYNQGLEIAQTAAAWRSRDSKNVLDWFKKAQ